MRTPRATHPSVGSKIKQCLDLALASVGLIGLLPLLAVIGLAIYREMGRPILFRQVRVGYRSIPFTILKFRTMRDLERSDGKDLPDEARTTSLGRLLRRTSLDELPQLWNVLRRDMSLIGPRPQVHRHLAACGAEQLRRHEVRPGMTGWAQVNGRNALSWEEKFRLDCWYVDRWSNWLDLRIALRTIITVARCEANDRTAAASADPSRKMPPQDLAA